MKRNRLIIEKQEEDDNNNKIIHNRKYINNRDKMHERNKHKNPIDYKELSTKEGCEELNKYIYNNKYGGYSINYNNNNAVKCLTKCILLYLYNIKQWDIPNGYLIPPVPSRENYIHYIADLIKEDINDVCENDENGGDDDCYNFGGDGINGIDIGIGCNGIYSLLASSIYKWKMLGTDICDECINNINNIINVNKGLNIKVIKQNDRMKIFNGLNLDNIYAFSMCNPPFYEDDNNNESSSIEEGSATSMSSIELSVERLNRNPYKDYGGSAIEMKCKGGELGFLMRMVKETDEHRQLCVWFTCLCARRTTLNKIEKIMRKNPLIIQVKTITLYQGRQTRWVICWTYLNKMQRTIRLTTTTTTTTTRGLNDDKEGNIPKGVNGEANNTTPFYTF